MNNENIDFDYCAYITRNGVMRCGSDHINPENKYKKILFDTLQLFRKELCSGQFQDWKDADDWLFSRLNLTESDVIDIYRDRDVVYTGSCKKGD